MNYIEVGSGMANIGWGNPSSKRSDIIIVSQRTAHLMIAKTRKKEWRWGIFEFTDNIMIAGGYALVAWCPETGRGIAIKLD